jgi:hypothetical protein
LRVSTHRNNEGGNLQPVKGMDDGTLIVNDKVWERKEKFSVAPQPNTVMTTVSDRGHPQTPYSSLETAVSFLRLPSKSSDQILVFICMPALSTMSVAIDLKGIEECQLQAASGSSLQDFNHYR